MNRITFSLTVNASVVTGFSNGLISPQTHTSPIPIAPNSSIPVHGDKSGSHNAVKCFVALLATWKKKKRKGKEKQERGRERERKRECRDTSLVISTYLQNRSITVLLDDKFTGLTTFAGCR